MDGNAILLLLLYLNSCKRLQCLLQWDHFPGAGAAFQFYQCIWFLHQCYFTNWLHQTYMSIILGFFMKKHLIQLKEKWLNKGPKFIMLPTIYWVLKLSQLQCPDMIFVISKIWNFSLLPLIENNLVGGKGAHRKNRGPLIGPNSVSCYDFGHIKNRKYPTSPH